MMIHNNRKCAQRTFYCFLKIILTFVWKRDKMYFVRRNGGIGRRARFRSVW